MAAFTVIMRKKANDTRHAMTNSMLNVGAADATVQTGWTGGQKKT